MCLIGRGAGRWEWSPAGPHGQGLLASVAAYVAGWLVATWTGLTQVSMEARSKTSPRGGGWLVVLRVREGGLSELHARSENILQLTNVVAAQLNV